GCPRHVRRPRMCVPGPWPRALGQDRILGAREPTDASRAAQGLYATYRTSVVLALRLRAWAGHRSKVAQDSGPSFRDGRTLRVRQSAAPSLAVAGASV